MALDLYKGGALILRNFGERVYSYPSIEFMIIWASYYAYVVDALAARGDEGRGRLRKASGSRQTGFDPGVSEWGNPPLRRYR